LGYVVGMPFTQDPSLYQIQPHLVAFAEEFKNFPAHLHINCHASSRGMGVGKELTLQLIDQFHQQGVKGLHIMTGPTSDNRVFYSKLGFNFEQTKNSILLMGREL
jgi:GNAT superfamily N-acetyltransferase